MASQRGKATEVQYEDWSRVELEEECVHRDIPGRSSMNKAEMIKALTEGDSAADEQKPTAAGPRRAGKGIDVDYDDWSAQELRDEATYRELAGRSGLNKQDMIDRLKEDDAAQAGNAGGATGKATDRGKTTDTGKSLTELKKDAPSEKADRGPTDDRQLPVGEASPPPRGERRPAVSTHATGDNGPRVQRGRLYSASLPGEESGDNGRLSFLHENGVSEGVGCEIDPDCEVTINGGPSTVQDLRRGDNIQVTGDPATEIAATR